MSIWKKVGIFTVIGGVVALATAITLSVSTANAFSSENLQHAKENKDLT